MKGCGAPEYGDLGDGPGRTVGPGQVHGVLPGLGISGVVFAGADIEQVGGNGAAATGMTNFFRPQCPPMASKPRRAAPCKVVSPI